MNVCPAISAFTVLVILVLWFTVTTDFSIRPLVSERDTAIILKISSDGSAREVGAVPSDKPFPGSLVYRYSNRNVKGLGWAADGTMFANEFGQKTWDELNITETGGNYGWPEVEGLAGGADYFDAVVYWMPSMILAPGFALRKSRTARVSAGGASRFQFATRPMVRPDRSTHSTRLNADNTSAQTMASKPSHTVSTAMAVMRTK